MNNQRAQVTVSPFSCPPATVNEWMDLWQTSALDLRERGLKPWEKESHTLLFLFPVDWYSHIPLGFMVETINGQRGGFDRNGCALDDAMGFLPFGVRVEI